MNKEFKDMCIEDKLNAIWDRLESLSRPAPVAVQEAEEVLTVKQCAALLGYSPDHIYAQASKSLIPHYRIGGSLRFRKSEVLEWVFRKNRKRTKEETEALASAYIRKSKRSRAV
jgi:excisionase family DNA binding protein